MDEHIEPRDELTTLAQLSAFQSLPPRRQAFVRNYLTNGFNGSKAARDAGYSPARTDQEAYRLVRNEQVRTAISELLDSEGLADPRTLAAYVRGELVKDSRKESQPTTRTKSLEILAKVSGLLGGQPPPAQHLHLHGSELSPENRRRILGMRRPPREPEGEGDAIEG